MAKFKYMFFGKNKIKIVREITHDRSPTTALHHFEKKKSYIYGKRVALAANYSIKYFY